MEMPKVDSERLKIFNNPTAFSEALEAGDQIYEILGFSSDDLLAFQKIAVGFFNKREFHKACDAFSFLVTIANNMKIHGYKPVNVPQQIPSNTSTTNTSVQNQLNQVRQGPTEVKTLAPSQLKAQVNNRLGGEAIQILKELKLPGGKADLNGNTLVNVDDGLVFQSTVSFNKREKNGLFIPFPIGGGNEMKFDNNPIGNADTEKLKQFLGALRGMKQTLEAETKPIPNSPPKPTPPPKLNSTATANSPSNAANTTSPLKAATTAEATGTMTVPSGTKIKMTDLEKNAVNNVMDFGLVQMKVTLSLPLCGKESVT
ncbi:MAG: hypothetical protein H0T62_02675, partial [Parachlamydiaceae bacterium]|nr:hypothetical protein [Parachlamydiaceae bacterium]